ncbi:group III truncated hemoglobin [Flavobacterium tegetincola]|uniref:group III truncated hemoglobin n=1 Tax=Flavobacterium tegetincola TaxID=150172 RepID=UPI00040D1171|nr:group III truncated hemoglobin [Flavobacterium tegetincola]
MNDIANNEDLHLLVDEFYKKLLNDTSIAYIFTKVVQIKLQEHLPVLVLFWAKSLFNSGSYHNNITKIHLDINQKEYLSPALFEIWLNHFNAAVDENFKGIYAEKIKTQALSIATVMQIKIHNESKKSS